VKRLSKKRREAIVLCGGLVEDRGELLAGMSLRMGGPVTEGELRRAFQWALRWSRRQAASFERKLRTARTKSGADRGAAG
jgi:hypothetical protein